MRSANFVEETTTSIAGTGGNGAVTLTAISGVPRFSSAFGTQATTIRYVIEDTIGKRFETGVGTVSAGVLTRTRPQVVWDGATYADAAPAPLAFGSAPTAGDVKIRLSATAEGQGTVYPGGNITVVGSGGIFQEYPVSSAYKTNTSGVAGVFVANVEYYWCYRLDGAGLLTGVAVDVQTAAGAGLKLALYSMGTNGLPAQKIVDFNLISTTSTGVKTDTTVGTWTPAGAEWLMPGWYAIGAIADGAVGLRGSSTSFSLVAATPFGRAGGYGDAALISINSKSYATGLPAAPDFTGAALRGENAAITGVWIGLKVTS